MKSWARKDEAQNIGHKVACLSVGSGSCTKKRGSYASRLQTTESCLRVEYN